MSPPQIGAKSLGRVMEMQHYRLAVVLAVTMVVASACGGSSASTARLIADVETVGRGFAENFRAYIEQATPPCVVSEFTPPKLNGASVDYTFVVDCDPTDLKMRFELGVSCEYLIGERYRLVGSTSRNQGSSVFGFYEPTTGSNADGLYGNLRMCPPSE